MWDNKCPHTRTKSCWSFSLLVVTVLLEHPAIDEIARSLLPSVVYNNMIRWTRCPGKGKSWMLSANRCKSLLNFEIAQVCLHHSCGTVAIWLVSFSSAVNKVANARSSMKAYVLSGLLWSSPGNLEQNPSKENMDCDLHQRLICLFAFQSCC